MRKVFLTLIVPFALTACATPPIAEDHQCSQPGGPPVNVMYGDSQIKVTPPLKEVKKNKYLKFKLIADNQPGPNDLDYSTVKVTIVAKDAVNKSWLNVAGTEAGAPNQTLQVCMPANQPLGVVEYLVKVEKVGVLDPRADVTPP